MRSGKPSSDGFAVATVGDSEGVFGRGTFVNPSGDSLGDGIDLVGLIEANDGPAALVSDGRFGTGLGLDAVGGVAGLEEDCFGIRTPLHASGGESVERNALDAQVDFLEIDCGLRLLFLRFLDLFVVFFQERDFFKEAFFLRSVGVFFFRFGFLVCGILFHGIAGRVEPAVALALKVGVTLEVDKKEVGSGGVTAAYEGEDFTIG